MSSTEGDGRQAGAWRMPRRSHRPIIVALLLVPYIVLFASDARSQCTARDVLHNQLTLKKSPLSSARRAPIRSAVDVPVWKTIAIGTFADVSALTNALNAVGCGIGDSAGEILARPAFSLSVTKRSVDLFAVSVTELGFQADTVSLWNIYARAQQLGFGLATAEIAPQLRLQYFDQPVGEFLTVGMAPIQTWKGEPVILTVANGGAGLIVIGQDGNPDAQVPVTSRFLFVRPGSSDWPDEAAVTHPPSAGASVLVRGDQSASAPNSSGRGKR